ncbi:unnamed protein product [marine sediment metagenome]|uniref:Uncharacterized protein n=1 Tax=marine sediment metagenome TaxID=412755 RepID=X1JRF8_9ZZZZ
MKKSTIDAIIGIFAGIILVWGIGVLTATDTSQYMYGANIGFLTGITIIVCLHRRQAKETKNN